MPAKLYRVAGRDYARSELLERCRSILYGYPNGNSVGPADRAFLESLIAGYHPRPAEKIGPGIDDIYIDDNYKFPGQPAFYIRRVDGSTIDFSFMACINGDKSDVQAFREAARRSIAGDVLAYKARQFNGRPAIPCELTGAMITPDEAHVDHVIPFADLVDAYITERGINLAEVVYDRSGIGWHFIDQDLASDFVSYHRRRAELRVVAAAENLRRPKKGDPPPVQGKLF